MPINTGKAPRDLRGFSLCRISVILPLTCGSILLLIGREVYISMRFFSRCLYFLLLLSVSCGGALLALADAKYPVIERGTTGQARLHDSAHGTNYYRLTWRIVQIFEDQSYVVDVADSNNPGGWSVTEGGSVSVPLTMSNGAGIPEGDYGAAYWDLSKNKGGWFPLKSFNFSIAPNPNPTPTPPTPNPDPEPEPNPDPDPAPEPTATPTPTPTPYLDPSIELDEDEPVVLSAGGWNETHQDYVYLHKQSGELKGRHEKPDPHITTLTATVKTGEGTPWSDQEVEFSWDMPGPAPLETKVVKTDGEGKARIDVVSGDELGSVVVKAKIVGVTIGGPGSGLIFEDPAEGEIADRQTLTLVKPKDNWSPLEVSPDLKGDPTVRIKLTHDGLPVTGHPISWGIDKILDSKGRSVARKDYGKYVVLSGPLSTTNAIGEAAVYLKFKLKAGTVFYSARDGVVFEKQFQAQSARSANALASPRPRVEYKNRQGWLVAERFDADKPVSQQKKISLDGSKRIFIVHSTFTFKYNPEEEARSARIVVESDVPGDVPLEVEVPLDGGEPTATRGQQSVRLQAADAQYYKTFAKEFFKVLYEDYESGAALDRVTCVVEGYGVAVWDTAKGSLDTVVLPYTIYQNRAEISKAIKVTINGASFVLSNREEMWNQVRPQLSAMPKGIINAAKNPGLLVAKMGQVARKAGQFTERGFDSMLSYAAKHPRDFARNTGKGAAYTSIAFATKRMAGKKLPGVDKLFKPELLGRLPVQTTSELVAISRQTSVLMRNLNSRFTPLVQKVLTRAQPVQRGSEIVSEASTGQVVAVQRNGWAWTDRLRMTMSGNKAKAGAGALTRCFVAGTLVLMANGTMKPIEQIRAGDMVLSRHEITGQTADKRVKNVSVSNAPATLALQIGNERVECTPEHPFYVPKQGFVSAEEIGVGTLMATRTGSALGLQKAKRLMHVTKPVLVYNFSVEDFQTYFVGRSKLWVHNACTINVKHIFHGEFDSFGLPNGFHHRGSIGHVGKARVKINPATGKEMVSVPDSNGVYEATVEIRNAAGVWKEKPSTMFPDSWSRARVLKEAKEAFADSTRVGENRFEGVSSSGVKIRIYLDEKGNINSAFPLYNKL